MAAGDWLENNPFTRIAHTSVVRAPNGDATVALASEAMNVRRLTE